MFLKNNYGIRKGPQQPDMSGKFQENVVGVYIVDWEKYLQDIKELANGAIEVKKNKNLGCSPSL